MEFPGFTKKDLEGSIVTHNHPTDDYSFSWDDLKFLYENNLKELRGVDKKYLYTAKIDKLRPLDENHSMKMMYDKYRNRALDKVISGDISIEDRRHESIRLLADRLGITYSRIIRT